MENPRIYKALLTTRHMLQKRFYKKVLCSISGGSDSDIVLDMVNKYDIDHIVNYIYFDTGLEFEATKEHIKFLEKKYGIYIKVVRSKKPIPLCVKQYGQPFLNKHISEMISRLQRHNFKWEDKPFEKLIIEYPKCKSALEWWCNKKPMNSLNIAYRKGLKEFMILNPPQFKISNKCCKYAKKDILKDEIKDYQLDINGVRKSEGGVRAVNIKSCFSSKDYDTFRPIFWFKDEDKMEYRKLNNISNSKCYSVYGLKRTGCAGCPYAQNLQEELKVMEKYEPKLYNAVINVFKDSYDYTEKYKEFRKNFK